MSLWRTGIVIDGPDAISVTVKGLGAGTVAAVEPLQIAGQSPEELADLLRALAHDRPQRRGQLRIVLPHEQCENYLRINDAPVPAESLTGDSIRWLEEECGFDSNAYEVNAASYLLGTRQAVAISVMERGLIDRYRAAFENAGLHDIVLVSPLDALIAMARSAAPDAGAPTRAIVQVGRQTTAALVVEDGMPAFYRALTEAIETQPSQAAQQGAETAQVLPQFEPTPHAVERLADELARTLQYYQQTSTRGRQVGHITLTALNLDLRTLAAALSQRTGVPTEMAGGALLQLPAGAQDATVDVIGEQRLTLPASVASQRYMHDGARLLATPSRGARLAQSRTTWVAVALVYLLILLGIWAALVAWSGRLNNRVVAMEEKEAVVSQELIKREKEIAARTHYRKNANALLRIKLQGVLASDMMSAANNLRPEAVRFERVTMEAGERVYTLRISGSVPGVESHDALRILDRYAAQLAALEIYDQTHIEKPQLNGAGALRDPNNPEPYVEPGQVPPAPVVNFTLVLQTVTPWRTEGSKS